MPLPQPVRLQARSFNCPNCGAAVVVRVPRNAQSVVCDRCRAVLDARTPEVVLLQKYGSQLTYDPKIPLGRRGVLRDEKLQCLGYLRRSIVVEGTTYTWSEYLLWNPYLGYRYLSEYEGHWTILKPTHAVPRPPSSYPGGVTANGRWFRHFQTARAEVTYVLGEFSWVVERGEKTRCHDYTAPPYVLSGEMTGNEYNWSIGVYLQPEEVWQGFALEGFPLRPRGIVLNQPSPYGPTLGRAWKFCLLFCAMAVVFFGAASVKGTPAPCFLIFALVLILAGPLFQWIQHASFETRRWQESDHAG